MVTLIRPAFERRLRSEIEGEVHFDAFTRGRYATDASIYQMMPLAVVVPRTVDDVRRTMAAARDEGIPVLARGGGTSQAGQTVNEALVVDVSRHLNRVISRDVERCRCIVEPGIVLDDLNRQLKPHGLWFPVDVSTASRATIGGMAGNNSCGGRSIRYGMMRDNVVAISAILASGEEADFGPVPRDLAGANAPIPVQSLFRDLLHLGERERDTIIRSFPKVMRRVGGYNIDALIPDGPTVNLAHLLVGSEGTLAFSHLIELKLSPLPRNRVLGVCHFPTFRSAMEATQHLVTLGPSAVELVDRTMIELSRDIPMFRPTVERAVRGQPDALLLVEFAEDEPGENLIQLKRLGEMMGDLGFSWDNPPAHRGGVVEAIDPQLQTSITELRKSGLNIMMSMKQDGKPVSFVEDCAVELKDLADYTAGLSEIFERHGTRGTWYAHASVGCLHVRPVLNLKLDADVRKMRAIAEEAFALVKSYKGSHSGEHGDGIVRSEFNEIMFGPAMAAAFREVKQRFDPAGLLNPGKIVDPPKMDDRRLFRYGPDYAAMPLETELDWSAWPGAGGGFQGAVEMCNNNGACRKMAGGVMCPSYRVTRDERDVTRGRANTLRLAITGQLGPDGLTADGLWETLSLCVSCKACKRECPTGVDMARMKIEVAAARARENGISLHDRLVGWLPRYAPLASRLPSVANAASRLHGIAGERLLGFTTRRGLPAWRADRYDPAATDGPATGREVILFADTFNTYFEPQNLVAAREVLAAAGFRVRSAAASTGGRPVCCGRTFLSVGRVDEARREMRRLLEAVVPAVERGVPVVGVEPSCLYTLRDELPALLPGRAAEAVAGAAVLFEEFIARKSPGLPLKPVAEKALLHGHCHQKAFDAMAAVVTTLRLVPDLDVDTVQSSCCGMAGAFGYGADTYDVSMRMAELDLLPAVRASGPDTLLVADGFSCREQISHGAGRQALHVARVLQMALR